MVLTGVMLMLLVDRLACQQHIFLQTSRFGMDMNMLWYFRISLASQKCLLHSLEKSAVERNAMARYSSTMDGHDFAPRVALQSIARLQHVCSVRVLNESFSCFDGLCLQGETAGSKLECTLALIFFFVEMLRSRFL